MLSDLRGMAVEKTWFTKGLKVVLSLITYLSLFRTTPPLASTHHPYSDVLFWSYTNVLFRATLLPILTCQPTFRILLMFNWINFLCDFPALNHKA